jgi:2,3-bisphosphoglycerate-independent phosphoglycerate mutase
MTGNLDTDLHAKFAAAAELLSERHFVAIHIKGTDIAAHDRRPLEKRDMISAVDFELGQFLSQHPKVTDGLRVVVSADHGTSSMTGNHMPDPVPVLVSTWNGPADPARFDEESAEQGALGLIGPGELSELLWSKSNRGENA